VGFSLSLLHLVYYIKIAWAVTFQENEVWALMLTFFFLYVDIDMTCWIFAPMDQKKSLTQRWSVRYVDYRVQSHLHYYKVKLFSFSRSTFTI
jgi:hypothetical protein